MDLYGLPDGRLVIIRPIRRDDVERLRAAHGRLSPLTRYRRFMTAKPYLTAADAAYLADIDGCYHYALVATFAEHEEDLDAPIVAVARFVRSPDDPETAEFAIVVGDKWQGLGVGRELMGRLVDAAVTRGVQRFEAVMLADNVAIHRLSERFAVGPMRRVHKDNTLEVEFNLPTRRPEAPAMIAGCPGS